MLNGHFLDAESRNLALLNKRKTKLNLRILFQRWDEREKHLAKFLRDLTGQFRQIRTTEGFATNRSMQVCCMHDTQAVENYTL